MTHRTEQTRVLLLVEDNPGDAELVKTLLSDARDGGFEIVHVPLLSEAVEKLRSTPIDVVVLDLRLPDCAGPEGVRAVRATAGEIPIVVLTGTDDERVAMECLDAGAQDYLAKAEAHAQNLRRSIGYAITRIREAQLRDLRDTLEGYRALSSATQRTTVTAAIAGSGAIAARQPALFEKLIADYMTILDSYVGRAAERPGNEREMLERVVTVLGDASGGPRDLLDVHVAALDRAIAARGDLHARPLMFEARLLALEMMGLLVDYYRVGQRRRFSEGARS